MVAKRVAHPRTPEPVAPYPEFGARVKALMARARVTYADLAPPVGVTAEMIRRYAEGLAMPRKEAMRRLAKLLGVSEAELQYGGGADPRRATDAPLTPDEVLLLDTYRQLGDTEKKIVRARAVELLEAFGKPTKANPFGRGGVQ